MNTSLIKLIPLIIQIEENLGRLYNNVASIEGQYNQQLKTAAMVLSRQVKDHADYYRNLQNTIDPEDLMVDETTFDFFRDTLTDFKNNTQREDLKDLAELYKYAIDVQKKSIVMMEQFQKETAPDALQNILNHLIATQEQNVSSLKGFIPAQSSQAVKD